MKIHIEYSATEEAIMDMVAEQLSIPRDSITHESRFVDDLGADSLDLVELVMAFEGLFFACEVADRDAEKFECVKDCFDYCEKHNLDATQGRW